MTRFSDYHIASDAQKIGDFSSLNAESIIALNPDFVILTGIELAVAAAALRKPSSPTRSLRRTSPLPTSKCPRSTTTLRMLRTCCDITGDEQAFAENGQGPADRIAEIRAKAEGKQAGSAVVLHHVLGRHARAVVLDADGNHAFRSGCGEHRRLRTRACLSDYSIEALIQDNPQTIFLLPMGNSDESAQQALAEQTTAEPGMGAA